MTGLMMGGVDNGARMEAVFPFYRGPVGVRRRGDVLELAWFGSVPRVRLPVEGMLNDAPVTITSMSRSATQRTMVVATAVTSAVTSAGTIGETGT